MLQAGCASPRPYRAAELDHRLALLTTHLLKPYGMRMGAEKRPRFLAEHATKERLLERLHAGPCYWDRHHSMALLDRQ